MARLPPRDGGGQAVRPHAGAAAVRLVDVGPVGRAAPAGPGAGGAHHPPGGHRRLAAGVLPRAPRPGRDPAAGGRPAHRLRPGPDRGPPGRLPRAGHRAGAGDAGGGDRDGRRGGGRARGRVGGAAVATGRPGRGAGLGRLRMERHAAGPLPARPAHPPPQPAHQRGRRTADGPGGGRRPGQHERSVVVPGGLAARGGVRGTPPGPFRGGRAHRPPFGHRQPLRAALRQRGGQLQRHAEGLLLLRRQRVRHPEPALLGGLRPPVPVALPGGGDAAGPVRPRLAPRARHRGGPGAGRGHRPGGPGRDRRAVEPVRGRRTRPRLRPGGERLRPVPRGPVGSPPQPGHGRAGAVLRTARPRRFGGDQGRPRVDADGRVLHVHDRPVPGLYGAGNVVASPAGPAYYGGGTSIGMGLVWGHLAGAHAAGHVGAGAPS